MLTEFVVVFQRFFCCIFIKEFGGFYLSLSLFVICKMIVSPVGQLVPDSGLFIHFLLFWRLFKALHAFCRVTF